MSPNVLLYIARDIDVGVQHNNGMSFFLQATLTNKFIFQAIKLNPNDAETYYQRAAMFKMVRSIIVFLRGACLVTTHVRLEEDLLLTFHSVVRYVKNKDGHFKSASCDGKNAIDCIVFKLIIYCLRQHFITAR